MKKSLSFFLSFFLLLAVSIPAMAQDEITLKNGEQLNVNIQNITPDDIMYIKPTMPDGPKFTIKKSDVFMIIYRDGSKEIFDSKSSFPSSAFDDKAELYAKDVSLIKPGMSYSQLKKVYDYKDYDRFYGDTRYSPAGMGWLSVLLPGLGQLVEGEVGSGLAYLISSEVFLVLGYVDYIRYIEVLDQESYAGIDNNYNYNSPIKALLYFSAALALNICSISDAVRTAKVKNMYYNDLRLVSTTPPTIKLEPYIDMAYSGVNNVQPVAGLSLKISF